MSELKKNRFLSYSDGTRRVHEVRRESNDEILHRAALAGEPIRLRVVVQIRHPEGKGLYVGWQGLSLKKDVSSVAQAREFIAKLKKLVEA